MTLLLGTIVALVAFGTVAVDGATFAAPDVYVPTHA
jgi:hypothetical protein